MSSRTGFIVGFGAGYVLGSKAGRQRYEDIMRWWRQVTGSPTVQRAAERTKDVASSGAKAGLSVVQQSVGKAGSAVKNRLHKDGSSTDIVADLMEETRPGVDYSG